MTCPIPNAATAVAPRGGKLGASISADTTGYTAEIVAPNGCETVTVVGRHRRNSRGSCSMSLATLWPAAQCDALALFGFTRS
jgi:hypothetical protein